jgi:hypothetical protein
VTVTLEEIERATARRVGPFYQAYLDRQMPTTASFQNLLVPALRSTVEQDLVTNLWLLRRGVDYQGNPVSVDLFDRQRLVAIYDPGRGEVTVDRPYSAAPAAGEAVEFHHLDPTLELREIVRAGLRRCLFEDRFNLGQGFIYEADLTAALPWLDDLNMVKNIQVAPFPTTFPGWSNGPHDLPFAVFGECGHVWIRVTSSYGAPYWGGLLVTVHRPHFSWVNGVDALDGPTQDADCLDVDLDYAAAAAHIEAWHLLPAKVAAAAAGGLQATQAMAALEFTRQSFVHRLPSHDYWGFDRSFGRGFGRLLVVNA